LQKRYGPNRARKISQRLSTLSAAETLADMRHFPGRCHELTGDRAGQLALDLDGPYRLIFEPHHNPLPRKDDGGLDWTAVTAITIITIEDYHG
jgi:proteic killer suppression protein